jgi:hypothetical protein
VETHDGVAGALVQDEAPHSTRVEEPAGRAVLGNDLISHDPTVPRPPSVVAGSSTGRTADHVSAVGSWTLD